VRCIKTSAILLVIITSYAEVLQVAVAGDTVCRASLLRLSPVGSTLTVHSVVSPAVTFATLPLAWSKSNPEAILKICELFICGNIH